MKKIFILAAAALMACTQIDPRESYVRVSEGEQETSFGVSGGKMEYALYSNIGHWQLINRYAEDEKWLTYYPTEGDGDGRFTIAASKNGFAAARRAELYLVSNGEVVATFVVTQEGTEPRLGISIPETGRTVAVKGETFSFSVDANIGWIAQLDNAKDSVWVKLGEYTSDSQTITCTANDGENERSASITVKAYGTGLSHSFIITQPDMKSSFEASEKRTIKEILDAGERKITDNVYVVGTVISDRSTDNYPVMYQKRVVTGTQLWSRNTMFIQDETAGMWIEFDDAAANIYELDDKVTVHLYGQSLVRDGYANSLKIDRLSSQSVVEAVKGEPVQPKIITDITKLSEYENMLVTIKDVEFVLPYGNLVNINESGYLGVEQAEKYQASADYNDLTLEYGHYLMDANGNLGKLYTTWSFKDRAQSMIPEGRGDVTGIVGRRYKVSRYAPYAPADVRQKEDSWCIRVRRESDMTMYQASPSTRRLQTIMQIGPWSANKTALESIMASQGQGQLKHSVGVSLLGSTSGTTDQMYWAWAHARNCDATYDPAKDAWTPTYGNSVAVQYTAVMAQNWWKNTAAYLSDTDGCCWILSNLTTRGCKGRLFLAFTASSNTSGPIEFCMEWADTDDAKVWTPITTYVCASWHCDIHAPEYVFELPDALKDRESFALRLRATIQRNSSDTDDVASGTSRLGIIRMETL